MIVLAVALPLVLAVGPFVWLRRAVGSAVAAPVSVAWGAFLMALAGALSAYAGSTVALAFIGVFTAIASAVAVLRVPLVHRPPHGKRESLVNRAFGIFLLVIAAGVLLVYLWANAVHPPVLADTIFKWSGPARGLGPVQGFPLRLSAMYYALADTDLGWKFLWSALNLLPWLALFGMLRGSGRGLLAAGGAVLAVTVAFSALFWGSSGQPFLFLAGVIMLLWACLEDRDDAGFVMAWPLVFIAVWSGPFWAALAAMPLAAAYADAQRKPEHRGLAAIAAAVLAAYWLAQLRPAWPLLGDIVPYYARDAWNTARYGPLTYLTAAFLLRSIWMGRKHVTALVATVVMLVVFALELASRKQPDLQVLLHIDGNQMFLCVLVIAWFLAVLPAPRRT